MNEAATQAAASLQAAEQFLQKRQLAEARSAFDEAEAAGADPNHCSGGRWLAAMLAGDFEAAWQQSDALRRRGVPDPHRFWQGEDLRGKRVIVRCLHGLGDAVQMLRYAPFLHDLAAEVIYEVPPRMLPLAPYFAGVSHVITWGENAPARSPRWDVQVEVMELPFLFRTLVSDLPLATRYLHLPADVVKTASRSMGARGKPRVGVVWACGDWNPDRNIPFALLQQLFASPAIEFWSLQGHGAAADAAGTPLHDAASLCGDGLLALAATVAHLDLVITPDTLAAHLAGSLGKPAWLLLQHAADWRWMHDRDDSPWYPSLRLFRQPTPGDWTSVIRAVQGELATSTTKAHQS